MVLIHFFLFTSLDLFHLYLSLKFFRDFILFSVTPLSLFQCVYVYCLVSSEEKTNKNVTKTEIANKDAVHLDLLVNRMAAKKTSKGWGGHTYTYICIYICICIYNLNVWEATTLNFSSPFFLLPSLWMPPHHDLLSVLQLWDVGSHINLEVYIC